MRSHGDTHRVSEGTREIPERRALSRRALLTAATSTAVGLTAAGAIGVPRAHAITPDIVLDRTARHQPIDGFGASFAGSMERVGKDPAFDDTRAEIVDLLFSPETGIGLNIARMQIGCFSKSQRPGEGNTTIFSHWQEEEGPFNWASDRSQVWAAQRALSINPDVTFAATPWSAPYWMKDINSCRGILDGVEGHLKPDYYDTYGTYLAAYVKHYPIEHGIPIDYLSIQNEPGVRASYQGCIWTYEEYAQGLKAVAAELAEEGLSPKLFGSEDGGFWRTKQNIEHLHANAEAWDSLDVVASHSYGVPVQAWKQSMITHGKPFWMTERTEYGATYRHALDMAERVFWMLTAHNARAYLYWLGVVYPSRNDLTGPVALIGANEQGEYAPNKKYYMMGHYSKFIGRGHVRIDASGSNDDFLVAAFTNPAARRAVTVIINRGASSVTKTIGGLEGRALHQYRTSEAENLRKLRTIRITEDGQATVTVPRDSVVTLVELGRQRA